MGVTSPLFLQAQRINSPPEAAATSSPAADATSSPNFSGIDVLSGHAKTIELETVSFTVVIIDGVHFVCTCTLSVSTSLA
jgi:hypothetical protein